MRSPSSCRSAALVVLAIAVAALDGLAAQATPPLFASFRDTAPAIARPGTARARVVSVRADLLAAAFDPRTNADAPFELNLFDDQTFRLRRVRIDAATAGYRTWVATSGPGDDVVAALTLGPTGLSGTVLARGRAYAFEPAAAGGVVVRELSLGDAVPELPALLVPARQSGLAPLTHGGATGTARIDVLVLYTPAARVRAGGPAAIQAALANAVAVTNTALQRSAVDASLTTVGLQELPYVESASGLVADLSTLAIGGSLHAAVDSVRAAAGADLVALVVGRATPSAGCGVAYLGPSPAAIYSVTEEACLVAGQWSFSHELGHNLGADHAPGDPVVSPVPYARGYRDSAVRTLMAYPAAGTPARLLNFSSSIVREPAGTGSPTGNSLQDNARQLAETAATVAAFSSAASAPLTPVGFSATVTGHTVSLTWQASAGGGPMQLYVVEAGTAPGGTDWEPFTTTTPSITFPDVLGGRYYARVRSVGSGGSSPPTPDLVVEVGALCNVPGPAMVSATVGPGRATLAWFAPPGTDPTSYEVGLGSVSGAVDLGTFAVGTLTGATVPAPPGQYFVRARGVNACGPGGVSNELRVVVP